MLPIVDNPTLQYGVEEAVQSGLTNIILVTSRGKSAMEDHFDEAVDLINFLERKGKKEHANIARGAASLAPVAAVRRGDPRALGHAVLVPEHAVGNEPFAVILAD